MQMGTVRRTRDNKVAHLFIDFENGAASGYKLALCNRGDTYWTGVSDYAGKWTDAPNLKLCNNCAREFHKKRKQWIGEP